jgi:hypothetical protein
LHSGLFVKRFKTQSESLGTYLNIGHYCCPRKEESVAQSEILVAARKRFSRLTREVSYKNLESWQDGDGYSDSE